MEKLRKEKVEKPQIKLSNFKEIDLKFKDFCDEYQEKNFGYEKKSSEIFYDRKTETIEKFSTIGSNNKTIKSENLIEFTKKEKNKNLVNNLENDVKDFFKKNYLKKVNPIVEYFGNSLIASVFHALLIKSINNNDSQKLELSSKYYSFYFYFFYNKRLILFN